MGATAAITDGGGAGFGPPTDGARPADALEFDSVALAFTVFPSDTAVFSASNSAFEIKPWSFNRVASRSCCWAGVPELSTTAASSVVGKPLLTRRPSNGSPVQPGTAAHC